MRRRTQKAPPTLLPPDDPEDYVTIKEMEQLFIDGDKRVADAIKEETERLKNSNRKKMN